ncbi:ABC transporter permease [Halobacillus litoralis]|uniref:ABC transporter permease n=1 Tax=Halobacillus litoralis TaxID=45668 RepID=UPI001CD7822A|nr:ABC transporter permease subunit [Halobacillus litoralis]MCA1023917.1 ABC transporter permease subunit [Halobacillus litoralis]
MNQRPRLFLVITLLFFLLPVLILAAQSFSAPWRFPSGSGLNWELGSYEQLLQSPMLWKATFTSIWIGFIVLMLNVVIGVFTGKALTTVPLKGRPWVEALLLSPILIPVLAIAMGLHIFMIRAGLADTVLGVIIIHLVPTVPYSIKIFHNSYQQIGRAMLEQPHILGSGFFRQLFTIELPLLKPALRSVTFLTIVISLSQYAITAIIGGGRVLTLPLVFFPFLESADASVMSAFSLWFAVIPVVMYTLVEAVILLLPYSRLPWRNKR